jgi:hypothetical protein
LVDGRGLVTAWLIVAAQLEVHGRGLPAQIPATAETLIILDDANWGCLGPERERGSV